MSKNNNVRIVTPIGISQYAWLTTPDTQFDQDGHYKTNLIVNAKESQSVVKAIDDEIKKSVTLAKEKTKCKEPKMANLPYEEEIIEGKPTGNLIFKFKTFNTCGS